MSIAKFPDSLWGGTKFLERRRNQNIRFQKSTRTDYLEIMVLQLEAIKPG